jgi:hypothetical protein
MKAMDKSVMMHRNKVHRARAERDILAILDHPFLPTLYSTFQVPSPLRPTPPHSFNKKDDVFLEFFIFKFFYLYLFIYL